MSNYASPFFFTVYQYSFLDRFTQLGLFDTRTVFRLFVCSFSSHSKIFHSCGDVTIADEGLYNYF